MVFCIQFRLLWVIASRPQTGQRSTLALVQESRLDMRQRGLWSNQHVALHSLFVSVITLLLSTIVFFTIA